MNKLASEEMVALFAILVLGHGIGRISIRGLSLGTAGVLFSALVFGHFGVHVPKVVMDLGLLLFVYAVGLQAGPRFFRTFREAGSKLLIVALGSVLTASVVAVALGWYLALTPELVVGMLCGAITNTPALAAAIDAVSREGVGQGSLVSVGYGIAYPLSMLGTVLLVQFLPRILRRDVRNEEPRFEAESGAANPALEARQFVVSNPNCDGRSIREVNPKRMSDVNISRIRRGNEIFTATPDTILKAGDVVRAVGIPDDLEILRVLLGEETQVAMDVNKNILSVDVDVTEPSVSGRKLRDLQFIERFNVVVTRLRREGIEFAPKGNTTLLVGDQIRVVGERGAVDEFIAAVGGDTQRLEETTMAPFLIGLLLGVTLGNISFPVGAGLHLQLGSAGGAFLMSLLVGHFGGMGRRLSLYVPQAAKNLSRELGLMLFLAGAGTTAGSRFVEVFVQQGAGLFLAGAVVTISALVIPVLLCHVMFRLNVLATMGAVSACMTNPPGLGAAQKQTEAELPTLAYAGAYPVALIAKIVVAQVLIEILY